MAKQNDVYLRQVHAEERRPWVLRMLSFFMLSKVLHLAFAVGILARDAESYIESDSTLTATYQDKSGSESAATLKTHVWNVLAQYIFLIIINIVAMVITKKANMFMHLTPWLVALIQLCELPIHAVFPAWYNLLIAVWLGSSLFFVLLLSAQNMLQALPIVLLNLVLQPTRLLLLLGEAAPRVSAGFLVFFLLLMLAVCVAFAMDVTAGKKSMLGRLTEAEKQMEFFKQSVASFPDGVMIAQVYSKKS